MRIAVVLFILASCGATYAAVPVAPLSLDGMGEVKFGMSVDDLERALNDAMPYSPYANHGCSVVTVASSEAWGLSYTIEDNQLMRINVEYYGSDQRAQPIRTDTGVGLGSSEEDVTKAYAGRIRITPNPEDPAWHTLTVDAPDHARGIIFETDGKAVKSFRAGLYPAVGLPSSCS